MVEPRITFESKRPDQGERATAGPAVGSLWYRMLPSARRKEYEPTFEPEKGIALVVPHTADYYGKIAGSAEIGKTRLLRAILYLGGTYGHIKIENQADDTPFADGERTYVDEAYVYGIKRLRGSYEPILIRLSTQAGQSGTATALDELGAVVKAELADVLSPEELARGYDFALAAVRADGEYGEPGERLDNQEQAIMDATGLIGLEDALKSACVTFTEDRYRSVSDELRAFLKKWGVPDDGATFYMDNKDEYETTNLENPLGEGCNYRPVIALAKTLRRFAALHDKEKKKFPKFYLVSFRDEVPKELRDFVCKYSDFPFDIYHTSWPTKEQGEVQIEDRPEYVTDPKGTASATRVLLDVHRRERTTGKGRKKEQAKLMKKLKSVDPTTLSLSQVGLEQK